ncbi:MAG: hypothetical protein D6734_09735, partial [Candidatus Schekmanbacteria bacterium]
MNKKFSIFVSIFLFLISISYSAIASDPPPTGLTATVVPTFDLYGNAQKKIQISWDAYHSIKICCNNEIDRLLGYDLTIVTKRQCVSSGTTILHLSKDQTSYTTLMHGDTNIVAVSVSARLLTKDCYKCGSAGSYSSDQASIVVNMAKEGCNAYLSIPPQDTDICSAKKNEVGEPVNILNGEMTIEERDFKIEGINLDFEFKRDYSSRQQIPAIATDVSVPVDKSNESTIFSEFTEIGRNAPSSTKYSQSYFSLKSGTPIGWGWSHSFSAHLDFLQDGNVVRLVNQKGRSLYFYKDSPSSSYYHLSGKPSQMSLQDNGDSTFTYKDDEGKLFLFGSSGELLSIISPEGNHIELEYDINGQLIKIYDTLNRHYSLNYDSNGRITSITEDSHSITLVSYTYDSLGRLVSATYPDNSTTTYEYNDPNDNLNITKITTKDGRIHLYTYDTEDRVVSFSDDDGKHFSFLEYNTDHWYTKITNTKGVDTYFHYESINRTGLLKHTTGNTCSTCTSPYYSYTNDSLGRIIEEEDSYGNITSFENFDNFGNPQLIRHGKGSSEEQSIYLSYHPEMKVPLSVKTASVFPNNFREFIADYDNDGDPNYNENPTNLIHQIILKGFTKDLQKNIIPFQYRATLSYDSYSRLTSFDGWRNDLSDITTFDYYASDDTKIFNRYRLKSITDPLGNKYIYDDYDIYGNAGKITLPDGTFFILSYDNAGNLIEIQKDTALWQFNYYPGGVLHYEKFPEGNIIEYFYNELGDLKIAKLRKGPDIQSSVLETAIFSYDSEGNLISFEIKEGDENGTTVLNESYSYGYKNELKYIYPDASNSNTKIEFATSLLLDKYRQASLPEGQYSMAYTYDSLLRLKEIIEYPSSDNLATNYTYDNLDNIIGITDSIGNETSFEYDDLGRILNINSAERGEKIFSYSALMLPAKMKDAFGRERHFSYDALGRLIKVDYIDENKSLTLKYDEALSTYGKGRLTSVSDENKSLRYQYDVYGNITKEESTVDGKTFSIGYSYDDNGRITKVDYPSGLSVFYSYIGSWEYPDTIEIKKADNTTIDISITRGADDKIKSISYPSQLTEIFGYDSQYRINSHSIQKQDNTKVLDLIYSRDIDGNITFITDTLNVGQNYSFTYDAFGRMTNSTGPFGNISFYYDSVGNRTQSILNGIIQNYTYDGNKLMSISGNVSKSYSYNLEGKLVSAGNINLTYDKDSRI